jgi:hypothetical protein
MNRHRYACSVALLLGAAVCASPALAADASVTGASLAYPATRAGDVVDDYFGRKVADPYRWLENLDSADTAAWVTAQNKLTFGYLETLPKREQIRQRLTQFWDYQRTSLPQLEAQAIWFQQNSGLQRQAPLYRATAPDAKAALVLDPNMLSPDGSVQMAQWSPSPNGRYLAYTLAPGGSDVQDIKVRDLTTGQDLPEVVRNIKFSGVEWTKDSRGFFYSRYKGTESSATSARWHLRRPERRRPLAVRVRGERHHQPPPLDQGPRFTHAARLHVGAAGHGSGRGRHLPGARRRERRGSSLHELPGAQGSHRRRKGRRERPHEVAYGRSGGQGRDR